MASSMYVGIDVAKAMLDVACSPAVLPSTRYTNDWAGITLLVRALEGLGPTLIVLEATGGYETAVTSALVLAGLPVAVVNPRQVRDFAKATGQLAKTDAIDAAVLARFADRMQPTPRPVPEAAQAELLALVTRRQQLVEMLVAERNRLALARPSMKRSLDEHIRWLQARIRDTEQTLQTIIKRSPVWRAHEQLLRSVPGIGPHTASRLLVSLPELGLVQAGPSPSSSAWPRSMPTVASTSPDLGRPRARPRRALYGHGRRRPPQRRPPPLLPTPPRRRQTRQSRPHRRDAQTAEHS